jgi:hypothetical protein
VGGVEEFQLEGDGGTVGWRQPVQFDQWGVADQFGYVVGNAHGFFLPELGFRVFIDSRANRSRPNAQFCIRKEALQMKSPPVGWRAPLGNGAGL